MGPQNALEGTGLMLISGEPARIELVKPLLAPMTGKLMCFACSTASAT